MAGEPLAVFFIIRNGLRRRDSPTAYGPHKNFYSRRRRWSGKGIFARTMARLAAEHGEEETVTIDATYLKAHRTATSMAVKKGGRGRLIGRTKGGMNTKLPATCDSQGRPLDPFIAAGQVSAYIGAWALLGGLPNVKWLLDDRGYDANWLRDALQDEGTRLHPQSETMQDTEQVRQAALHAAKSHRDHVREAQGLEARYERCPKIFLSAIARAATARNGSPRRPDR